MAYYVVSSNNNKNKNHFLYLVHIIDTIMIYYDFVDVWRKKGEIEREYLFVSWHGKYRLTWIKVLLAISPKERWLQYKT